MALNMGCFPVEKPATLVDTLRPAAVGKRKSPFFTQQGMFQLQPEGNIEDFSTFP